jgi:hypothetical protein
MKRAEWPIRRKMAGLIAMLIELDGSPEKVG